jgi:hypothetical protein
MSSLPLHLAYAIGNPSGEDAEEEKTSRNEIRKALRVKEDNDVDMGYSMSIRYM